MSCLVPCLVVFLILHQLTICGPFVPGEERMDIVFCSLPGLGIKTQHTYPEAVHPSERTASDWVSS